MRSLSNAEILVVAGGFDPTEDPLHPKFFGDKKKDSGTQCPDGYHHESGTATGGGVKGGDSVSVMVPIPGTPVVAKAGGNLGGNLKPATWDGCTPNGYHHDPSAQGKVVRDQ